MTTAVISRAAVAPPVADWTCVPQRDGGTTGTLAEAAVLPFQSRISAVARRAAETIGDIDHTIDHDLVRAIAHGSALAMRALFMRHQTRVYRFIKRMVRDHAEAEDLTSDVFLAVWRRADRFEGRSRVSTWLFGIARHKALSALQAVPPILRDDKVMLTVRDPAPGPDGDLYARERVAALRCALTALSHEHRQIIDLVYYRGKSIKEIGDTLGIGPGTVKTRMFYARKRLAALMTAAGV
jgi:RNA polymerase sigma-70 factor (ECF subfamily)